VAEPEEGAEMAQRGRSELKGTSYEVFVGALSVLSIVNLLLMLVTTSEDLDYVLLFMNAVLSIILFLDFLYRLWTSPSRANYFFRQFGWADLLASVPVQQVKVFRIFRIIRVIRLLREIGPRTIWNTIVRDRANSALYTLLLIGLLMLEFGSLGMLQLEAGKPGANIETASDSLWYSIVTMATVGYGDQFPVTNPGRLLGSAIIVVGVGIFGTLTGYLANAFVNPSRGTAEGQEADPAPIPSQPDGEAPGTAVAVGTAGPGAPVPDGPSTTPGDAGAGGGAGR
jgi:voltage-gated potassium channel Kch